MTYYLLKLAEGGLFEVWKAEDPEELKKLRTELFNIKTKVMQISPDTVFVKKVPEGVSPYDVGVYMGSIDQLRKNVETLKQMGLE